jgi:DegV family protein with EDD domain
MGTPTGRTVIVTDSTAMLPPEVAAGRGIVVVPLQVVIGATVYDEGAPGGATPDLVAGALKEWTPVSTSRPAPAILKAAYEQAARDGATAVLSLHLSGEMSGTFESAQLAARDAPIPVTVVDSRQVGVATGFAALTAADVLDAGGSVEEAAAAARQRA